jgi:hypothetical protein
MHNRYERDMEGCMEVTWQQQGLAEAHQIICS